MIVLRQGRASAAELCGDVARLTAGTDPARQVFVQFGGALRVLRLAP